MYDHFNGHSCKLLLYRCLPPLQSLEGQLLLVVS